MHPWKTLKRAEEKNEEWKKPLHSDHNIFLSLLCITSLKGRRVTHHNGLGEERHNAKRGGEESGIKSSMGKGEKRCLPCFFNVWMFWFFPINIIFKKNQVIYVLFHILIPGLSFYCSFYFLPQTLWGQPERMNGWVGVWLTLGAKPGGEGRMVKSLSYGSSRGITVDGTMTASCSSW